MPGRKYEQAGSSYRFSINGQEKTPEIAANTTTAEFWQYDARIVRRWNVDPVVKEFESPYLCFSGNPIFFSDLKGMDSEDPEPKETSTEKNPKLLSEVIVTAKRKNPEKMSWEDIPSDKYSIPSLIKSTWNQFTDNYHKTAAQAFAATRQNQPNVGGVAMFDLDDNTTIVTTHVKVKSWNGDDWEKTVWTTYSIFRADRYAAWWTGPDKALADIKEEDFFKLSHDEIYSERILSVPIGGGGTGKIGSRAGSMIQAGFKVGKFASLKYAATYGVKAYKSLRGLVNDTQVHHLIEQRFADLFKDLGNVKDWPSIILTKSEHIRFNTLWRQKIGLNNWKSSKIITSSATRQDVLNAAREIYADYPEILKHIPLK